MKDNTEIKWYQLIIPALFVVCVIFYKSILAWMEWYHWVLAVILLGIIANISEAIEKKKKRKLRYEEYVNSYGEHIADLIMDGDIEQGMTTEQVRHSLGRPDKVERESGRTEKEVWKYDEWRKGAFEKVLKFEDGVLVGYKIKEED